VTVTVPAESRVYIADNRTTGAFTVTLAPPTGSGLAVKQGERALLYCDASNVYPVAGGVGGGGGGSESATSNWRWTTTLSGAPNTGILGVNNATYSAATEVRLAYLSDTGVDSRNVILALETDDELTIQDFNDANITLRYLLTGPAVDQGTYATLPITWELGAGTLANNVVIIVRFIRNFVPEPAAPPEASYLVAAGHSLLTDDRVATNTPEIAWDFATAGQAKLALVVDSVAYNKIQNVQPQRVLGRSTAGAGDIEELTLGANMSLVGGVLNATVTNAQPLDATLTALAGLATGADTLPYFTGTDTAAQTTLSAYMRTLLDDATQAQARTTLGLTPGTDVQAQDATLTALASLTTGANQLPFFTGTDTASLTTLTAFMRGLLDDPDAASARATLGIAESGEPTIAFTELTDTPTSYTGQSGKVVVVNGTATGLEFVDAPGGSFQPLDATLTALAGLTTAADTVPLFTGVDTAALLTVTPYARTFLDDADQAAAQTTLGLLPGTTVQAQDATLQALAGLTTGADLLPFFTGVDVAQTTVLSGFARQLLDDPDAATMRATLEIPGGGGGSSDFLGLSDTPDSYVGQAGKGVVVNGTATGLEFTTAATGSYDLGLTWAETLPASQVLLRYPFPRGVDFPAGLTGSRGVSAVAATATTTLDIRKNNTSVGSVQWAASATTATFTMASATSFTAGDILTVHAPASADATLADLGLSLAGTRSVVPGEMGATTFLGLTDTPAAYTGQGGNLVTVNAGATALDYTPLTAFARTLLDDTDQAAAQGTLGIATTFLGLNDTPNDYAGNASKVLRVNAAANATEFGDALGTMATQNANAVAITGGTIRLPVQSTVGGIWIEDAAGSSLYGIRSQVASGTEKYNIFADGTAPNYFAGKVGVNTSNIPDWLSVEIDVASGAALGTRSTQASTVTVLLCHNTTNTIVGSITSSETATAFNTTSDARLKSAIAPLTGALDVLRTIPARTWRWRADDSPGVGFVGHEVQGVVQGVVSGEVDAVDEEGRIQPQQIDLSKLVPWLWGALQETLAQVEALSARVQALEAEA
jgi:hypothetical protein